MSQYSYEMRYIYVRVCLYVCALCMSVCERVYMYVCVRVFIQKDLNLTKRIAL